MTHFFVRRSALDLCTVCAPQVHLTFIGYGAIAVYGRRMAVYQYVCVCLCVESRPPRRLCDRRLRGKQTVGAIRVRESPLSVCVC